MKYAHFIMISKSINNTHMHFHLFIFEYIVEARGRAGTLDGAGRNRQKQDEKRTRMEKESPRRKNWEIRRDLGGVNEGRKDHAFGLGTI